VKAVRAFRQRRGFEALSDHDGGDSDKDEPLRTTADNERTRVTTTLVASAADLTTGAFARTGETTATDLTTAMAVLGTNDSDGEGRPTGHRARACYRCMANPTTDNKSCLNCQKICVGKFMCQHGLAKWSPIEIPAQHTRPPTTCHHPSSVQPLLFSREVANGSDSLASLLRGVGKQYSGTWSK
jgi:hypothetical protein